MTTWTMFMVVVGAATCASWVFKLVDIIERPRREGWHRMAH